MDIVVADGAVNKIWRDQIILYPEEWDTDKDGWRDDIETKAKPPTNPFDSLPPYPSEKPDVYWTTLAGGQLLPIDITSGVSSSASVVRPFSAPKVILYAAPAASTLRRPNPFSDGEF